MTNLTVINKTKSLPKGKTKIMLALLFSPRNFKHQGKNGIMMFTKFLAGREHGIHEYPANILIRHLTD